MTIFEICFMVLAVVLAVVCIVTDAKERWQ